MIRSVYVPLGRCAEYVPPAPERTAYRAGKSWDSPYEFRAWPSRGAMLEACRMSDTGKIGAQPWRDYTTSRYPAALALLASVGPVPGGAL